MDQAGDAFLFFQDNVHVFVLSAKFWYIFWKVCLSSLFLLCKLTEVFLCRASVFILVCYYRSDERSLIQYWDTLAAYLALDISL